MKTSQQIVSRTALLAFGMTHHSIARAVERGDLVRLRRGWYATPAAAPEAVRAVKAGGVATALTATRLMDIWTPDSNTLHVAVPPNSSRLRANRLSSSSPRANRLSSSSPRANRLSSSSPRANSPRASGDASSPRAATPGRASTSRTICLHWRQHGHTPIGGVASVVDALADAVQCQPEEYAVVVIDSALNKNLVTLRELEAAFARCPRRYLRALNKADGRSQSGTETLVRLRLRRLGIHVSVQVPISGVGTVDLVIGDRFVIECDSRRWHTGEERYKGDRHRDRQLIGLNYLPMRITYEMVLFDWAETERVILSRIANRDHLWPRRSKTGKTASRRANTRRQDGSS